MKSRCLSSYFLAAVFCALFVCATPGSATLIGPGDSFKVNFDLTGKGPSASYDNVGFVLFFTPLDYLDQNEGFSFQLFDSSGAANSDVATLLYTLPVPTPNLQTQSAAYVPVSGQGYFLFTAIVGTFDIGGPNGYGFGTLQTAYGSDSVTTGYTGVLPATLEKISSVPDSLSTGLSLGILLLLFLGGRRAQCRGRS